MRVWDYGEQSWVNCDKVIGQAVRGQRAEVAKDTEKAVRKTWSESASMAFVLLWRSSSPISAAWGLQVQFRRVD